MNFKKADVILCANMKDLLNNPQTLDSIIFAGCEKARKDARNFLMTNIDWMKLR